jgi:hypothetical protein
MLTLFVAVEAKPGRNVVFEDAEVEGYYQRLGVTARSEDELRRLIQNHLDADLGSSLIEISERWMPDFAGADSEVREEVGDLNKVGIWYSSGKAWFGPEEPDED